ncbi:MAG TPA: hypothetical protein VFS52_05895 [Steroidobacteraceae bacterium]|nr:hypothetical protein [Steroidobacteraceae bacterium]
MTDLGVRAAVPSAGERLCFPHRLRRAVDDIWEWYLRGFGPLRALHARLEAPARAALAKDVGDYHRHYAVECGLHVQREYLLTIGERR